MRDAICYRNDGFPLADLLEDLAHLSLQVESVVKDQVCPIQVL